MIDFRYHLVSMIAVFLALAVGLIVGVTALSGPAESLLHAEYNRVSKNNSTLAKGKQDLENQVSADQALAQSAAPLLLDHRLTGQNVVLVEAPSPDGKVTNGITAALRQAGATVTGEVQLNPQFMNTNAVTESSLTSLAGQQAAAAGVSLSGQPPNSAVAGQQAAAQVIAASILGHDGTGTAATVNQAVLSQFASEGYVTVLSGLPAGSPVATMAVLVIPDGPPPASGNGADQVLVAVAQELKAAGQATVMAGGVNAIGSGSAISAENGAGGAGKVSTVDNADTETGQIAVVWALVHAAAGKPATAFGVESGLAPGLVPTPSSSPTTPPPTTTGKRGAQQQ